jgi:hypothetical protein
MNRRPILRLIGSVCATALLGACAALNQLSVDLSTFGEWPAARQGGSYAFERLPSQQAQAGAAQVLEDAARPALARAGFTPVAAGVEPELLVQLGARVSRTDRSPWDDPLWWGGGYSARHRGAWHSPSWAGSLRLPSPRYEREVALLIRDRASGKPLFEARASSEGFQGQTTSLLLPLFAATLVDFPRLGVNPRRVSVPLTPD